MMIKSGVVAVIFAGFFLTGCVPKKAPSLVTSSGEAVAPRQIRRGRSIWFNAKRN